MKEQFNPQQVGLYRPEAPYSQEECESIIQKLEELLDGELEADKEKEVLEMINNCNYCLEQYNIERSFKDIIKKGFEKFKISNNLLDTVRNNLKLNGSNR